MGALRFGPIHGDTAQHQWNRSRFAGVVSGIAHCGNCIGVPTIGGEVQVFFRGKMNGCRVSRRYRGMADALTAARQGPSTSLPRAADHRR